jgi:hypothetical protein
MRASAALTMTTMLIFILDPADGLRSRESAVVFGQWGRENI